MKLQNEDFPAVVLTSGLVVKHSVIMTADLAAGVDFPTVYLLHLAVYDDCRSQRNRTTDTKRTSLHLSGITTSYHQ